MIYEFILTNCVLTDAHAEELRSKRGFKNDTIKRFRFISGGQHNLALEQKLLEKFKIEELLETGVFLKKGDKFNISPVLLDDRIIIPYLDKDGKATLLRPHKLGLKRIPVQIYQPFNIIPRETSDPRAGCLIITEGEFKAAAAWQLGASCIALPGVASYSGREKIDDLIKFLNDNAIKNICIIFDNEIKDDPKFPNFKPDAHDRYDTQYYAFIMAKMLKDFNVTIGTLPDSWRVNGKIDIDGALAMGKDGQDLDGICKRAMGAKEYYEQLEDEAKEVIKKKEAKRYFKTHIRVEFGKYVAERFNGRRKWDEEISNFTFRVVATHETAEGIIRELRFVNAFGKSGTFLSIDAEHMMSNDRFATFCADHGGFIWKGRKEDLYLIWEQEFLNDSGRHIIEPDCIGWLPDHKSWMFGNVMFTEAGELRPDETGTFWTEKAGYKPVALGVSSGKNVISEGVPTLNTSKVDFVELRSKLSDSIGSFEAKSCLGWAVAVLFMEDVFKAYGCFPFLFITGRRRSGKSTVAEWVMNWFGLENAGKQAGDTTSVAMQRYMSFYSSLPFFVDEYRNDARVTMKNGLFRNAYNRQSAGKGMKADFGIREAKIRGSLILAGEETPDDNALLTRCIVVQVSEIRRHINNFDWFNKSKSRLSGFTYDILSRRKELRDVFMSRLKSDKDEIAEHVKDDRLAINKAVVSAGYFTLFGKDEEFAKQFAVDLTEVKVEQEKENAVSMFFTDVQALAFDPKMSLKEYWSVSDGQIFLYFHGLYNVWARDYQSRKREAPFKAEAIRGYLKDESGFVGAAINHRFGEKMRSCVVFTESAAPAFIKDLVS